MTTIERMIAKSVEGCKIVDETNVYQNDEVKAFGRFINGEVCMLLSNDRLYSVSIKDIAKDTYIKVINIIGIYDNINDWNNASDPDHRIRIMHYIANDNVIEADRELFIEAAEIVASNVIDLISKGYSVLYEGDTEEIIDGVGITADGHPCAWFTTTPEFSLNPVSINSDKSIYISGFSCAGCVICKKTVEETIDGYNASIVIPRMRIIEVYMKDGRIVKASKESLLEA